MPYILFLGDSGYHNLAKIGNNFSVLLAGPNASLAAIPTQKHSYT